MLDFMRRVPLFRHLSETELRRIHKISTVRHYKKKALIFSKLESAKTLFIVRSGRVKVFSLSGSRKRKTFAHIPSGGFFGEMALLNGKVRSASVAAVEETELLCIDKHDFNELLKDHKFTLTILRTLSHRLRTANEDIENILFDGLTGRLCKKILQLSRANKGQQPKEVRVSRRELADVLGTTREPLARALGLLRRTGAIDVDRERITVCDPAKLRDLGSVHVRP